jgi:hypothetical protein
VTRVAAGIALIVALFIAVASIREVREGARAMEESDTALAAGDLPRAIASARAAAEARVPGSPYPPRAYERLGSLARDAEARGDERVAVLAWAAMRAAALETSGLGTGDATDRWRAAASEGIARVGARSWSGPEARATSEVRPAQAALEAALARSDLPDGATFLLLAVGGLTFFGGVARLLWVAHDRAALRRSHVAALTALAGGVAYVLACVRG